MAAAAAIVLTAGPASAQRLPTTVTPLHYDITVTPRPCRGEVQRTAKPSASGWPARHVHDRAQRRRDHVRRGVDQRRRQAAAADGRRSTRRRNRRPSRSRNPVPAGDAEIDHRLRRHPQRRPARPLSEQGEQPPLRGHAARGHRRAPHVPVVRRAGVQGDLRAHRDHRRRTITRSRTAPWSRTRRARRRQAHRQVRDHAEDVDVSRGARGRRLRVHRRHAPTASRCASARRPTRST